jgi:hypothetical protein
MKKCLLLAVLAGVASPVMAQELQPGANDLGVIRQGGEYSGRALVAIYDNWTLSTSPTASYRALFGRPVVADDAVFATLASQPYPLTNAAAFGRIGWALGAPAAAGTYTAKIDIYGTFNPAAGAGTNVFSDLQASFNSGPVAFPAGTGYFRIEQLLTTTNFTLQAGGITDPNVCFVQSTLDVNNVVLPNPLPAGQPGQVLANGLQIGTTTAPVYRDAGTPDGFITGAEGFTAAGVVPPTSSVAGLIIKVELDDTPIAPTAEDLGDASASATITRSAASASPVKWYTVSLSTGALDNLGTFIDIDTEGSASDVDMALFTSGGDLIEIDRDGGSGNNAQFSFGVGRRAAVGDGEQYDGRHFLRGTVQNVQGLPADTYFLAVGSAGTVFSNGFNTSGSTGGTFNLTVRSNTNGDPLAASVAPIAVDGGTISTLTELIEQDIDARRTVWWTFTTCRDATDDGDPGSTGSFLDISPELITTHDVDAELFLFDSAGNLVSADGAEATSPLPLLSFGDVSPVRPAAFAGYPDFDGIDGNLPAGTYYLACAYDGVTGLADPVVDGRFHLRNVGGSSGWGYSFGVIPSWSDCPAGVNLCNYDYNQDENVDLTDAQLMAQVAAGIITPDPSWLSGDMNGDENADLTDAQQLAQFVASGVCPI